MQPRDNTQEKDAPSSTPDPEEMTRVGVEKPADNPVLLDDAPAAPLTAPDETKGG